MSARLRYSTICSLDGYVADADGGFDWAVPDEEVLAAINAGMREVTTSLHGRRIYELMHVWETDPAAAAQSPESAVSAQLWRRPDKHVFSTTLDAVRTERTTLHRTFDPAEIARMKAAGAGVWMIDGPTLAAHALRAGLVDQVEVINAPALVGGGLPAFPDGIRNALRLTGVHRFDNGMTCQTYDVEGGLEKVT
ncbi:MAG: dihydrofolate reductase family protein [Actinobacteria bacterium]|nr:dihydrofolate reductase family protein [Actinomycetota bacterium]